MIDDCPEFAAYPRRWHRPSTSLCKWSLRLVAGIGTLMILPLVPARGAMQKRDAAQDDGHILWRLDSGG